MKPGILPYWFVTILGVLSWDGLQKYFSQFTIDRIIVLYGFPSTQRWIRIKYSCSFEDRNLPVTTHEM